MCKIFSTVGIASLILFFFTSIYDYSFTSIEGNNVSLSSYQQKTIIIATLPVTVSAENNQHLARLDSLSRAHPSTLVMIGVPSVEDGYTEQNTESLKTWYRTYLGNQFVISKGMYTHKTSANQHPLFKWLTDKNLNMHFDMDVEGIGDQFFISENGTLYGVLGPEAKWSNNTFSRLIQ